MWGFLNFNFSFLFFSKFCFSVNHFFHGSQVVATVDLFIAGSELKLLANSVSIASPHLPGTD